MKINRKPKKGSDVGKGLFSKARESTTAQDKIWNYLLGLANDSDFQKKIHKLRIKHGIPKEGFKKTNHEYKGSWQLIHDLNDLAQELGLSWFWFMTLGDYVSYNKWVWHSSYEGLINVEDDFQRISRIVDFFKDEEGKIPAFLNSDYWETQNRPIALYISPYASERDIIDFVKKVYQAEIKPLQQKYRKPEVKIGKINKRNTQVAEIRQLIWKNRGYSSKELARIIWEKFGKRMGYEYVAKIKAEETRKRK